MTTYGDAIWKSAYTDGMPTTITPPHGTMIDVFDAAVTRARQKTAVRYFDGRLTFAALDNEADALASALIDRGFAPGDRLGLYLQNNPQFVIGLIAAWKAGGCAVMINPMNKERELTHLLTDSGAKALLCLDTLFESVVSKVIAAGRATQLQILITTSAKEYQTRNDSRVLEVIDHPSAAALRLADVIINYAGRLRDAVPPQPDDTAVLTYTSGTTGVPKAAVNTHRAMSFNSYTYREWLDLVPTDSILAIAPLFHITGLVGHIGAALASGCPIVLTHRFEPAVMLDAAREHRPTVTIGAITALMSLLARSGNPADDFESLRAIYSGGAPVSPTVATDFKRATGRSIHNIYGLTETTSPCHATPLGVTGPVDPRTGALSVGVPVFNTLARVLDDDGNEVPVGQLGELVVSGPQVISRYWNRPAETAQAVVEGELRTGDIGYMDDAGWFYVIDRKKDMINASGYKVWPREVEDVLLAHPAVREAAVVGVNHPYRGETVKAYVSLKGGERCSTAELMKFCQQNMAAYKYPREIDILDDLPKTNTGKVLRRSLRDLDTSVRSGPSAAQAKAEDRTRPTEHRRPQL
jgi:long-chain acyl-CoA synthetase